jgi:hypothetical protein
MLLCEEGEREMIVEYKMKNKRDEKFVDFCGQFKDWEAFMTQDGIMRVGCRVGVY